MRFYDPKDWFWIVDGSTTQVYSSKARAYVPVSDPAYVGFIESGCSVTRIESEASLADVFAKQHPQGWYLTPRYVPVYVARERLEAAGLWPAAAAAIVADPAVMLKVTTLKDGLDVADPVVLGLLDAIGADPEVILA